MKLHISVTNYGVSYELNRTAATQCQMLDNLLTEEIEASGLHNLLALNHLWIRYDLHSQPQDMTIFPRDYPRALHTRQMVRLREFEITCALDWTNWKPRTREKAGLSRFPEETEVKALLLAYSRVAIVQAAIELGDSLTQASMLVGESPLIALDAIAKIGKKRQRARLSPRKSNQPTIPLEVTFPLELDRSEIRDLLEAALMPGKLGLLEGWSSGPRHHEVGFVVIDADTAKKAMSDALAANGYDHNTFGFDAED